MSRVVNPDAIWPGEDHLVCSTTRFGVELIHQSERDEDRAAYSVEVLNEHERNNARRERYFWRLRVPGEIPDGRKADAFHLP